MIHNSDTFPTFWWVKNYMNDPSLGVRDGIPLYDLKSQDNPDRKLQRRLRRGWFSSRLGPRLRGFRSLRSFFPVRSSREENDNARKSSGAPSARAQGKLFFSPPPSQTAQSLKRCFHQAAGDKFGGSFRALEASLRLQARLRVHKLRRGTLPQRHKRGSMQYLL